MNNIKKRIIEKSLRLSMIIPHVTKYSFAKVYLDTTTGVAIVVNEYYNNGTVKYAKAIECSRAGYSSYWQQYCCARKALADKNLYSDSLLDNMSCQYIKELYKCVKFMCKDTRPMYDIQNSR